MRIFRRDLALALVAVTVLTAGRGASAPGAGSYCGHTGFS